MSNRGRHKKKVDATGLSITVVNLVYHEIENFRNHHYIDEVTLYFREDENTTTHHYSYDIPSSISIFELIDFLKIRKRSGLKRIRIPGAHLVTDKYYDL